MSNINENIKKDLMSLYSNLYNLSQCETSENFFNKKILKSLKYKPEEVEEALNSTFSKLEKSESRSNSVIITNIQSIEQVKNYFEMNFSLMWQPDSLEEEKRSILKKITMEEIRHLYQIIFDIPLADNCKKIDALYKIRDYFENEKRTVDLTKNLF